MLQSASEESTSQGSSSFGNRYPALDEPRPVLTHGGLSDFDPWSEPGLSAVSARKRAWPFGLDMAAEVLEVIALALLMFMAVRFVAQNFIVDGSSMDPTFVDGDLLIVNKLAYQSFNLSWLPGTDNAAWRPFGEPEPGDVVVFRFPQNQNRDFIKRVIAVPGQSVEVREGVVHIDGVAMAEPYIATNAGGYDFGPEFVPEGYLFVLGDNRENSYDSHSWGLLERDLLIGRAELRYWPFERFDRVSHEDLVAKPAMRLDGGAVSSR